MAELLPFTTVLGFLTSLRTVLARFCGSAGVAAEALANSANGLSEPVELLRLGLAIGV